MNGKIAIIGAAGRVGSNTAFALQLGGIGSELLLLDVAEDVVHGEALDLLHGRAAVGGPRITAGHYEDIASADLIIVTAGLRRRPDESRLSLIARNAALFRDIMGSLHKLDLASDPVLLVVTNPVDILTYLAATECGWPAQRTIGLGATLDTLRFRSLLGEELNLDPSRIESLILGEHGDSMVPIWSSLRYDGEAIDQAPGYSPQALQRAFEATRTAGAECIRLKGGAGFAVGLAVRQVAAAILGPDPGPLPVSTLHETGEFAGLSLSVPTRLSRAGWVERTLDGLTERERGDLLKSAEILRQNVAALAKES